MGGWIDRSTSIDERMDRQTDKWTDGWSDK